MEQLFLNRASIGIIGGADGPTKVIISGPSDGSIWLILCALILAAGALIWFLRRRKSPKE